MNYNADKSVKCNVINMIICFGVVDSHIFFYGTEPDFSKRSDQDSTQNFFSFS